MQDNNGRELLIRVTIKDADKAVWIWDGGAIVNGVEIRQIADVNAGYVIADKKELATDKELSDRPWQENFT